MRYRCASLTERHIRSPQAANTVQIECVLPAEGREHREWPIDPPTLSPIEAGPARSNRTIHTGRNEELHKKIPTFSALAIVTSLIAASGAPAQDVAAGKTSFNKCLACHAIGEGAKNKVGPELNGLDGRKSGTAEGYSYSDANKNSGITWSKDAFLEYIKDPKAKIPGTKMAFAGIKNEKEANDLWAYIAQFDKDGKTK